MIAHKQQNMIFKWLIPKRRAKKGGSGVGAVIGNAKKSENQHNNLFTILLQRMLYKINYARRRAFHSKWASLIVTTIIKNKKVIKNI